MAIRCSPRPDAAVSHALPRSRAQRRQRVDPPRVLPRVHCRQRGRIPRRVCAICGGGPRRSGQRREAVQDQRLPRSVRHTGRRNPRLRRCTPPPPPPSPPRVLHPSAHFPHLRPQPMTSQAALGRVTACTSHGEGAHSGISPGTPARCVRLFVPQCLSERHERCHITDQRARLVLHSRAGGISDGGVQVTPPLLSLSGSRACRPKRVRVLLPHPIVSAVSPATTPAAYCARVPGFQGQSTTRPLRGRTRYWCRSGRPPPSRNGNIRCTPGLATQRWCTRGHT